MRIALTGASGFIGSTIAQTLHATGHSVTALVRTTSRRDHIETVVDRFVVGDQGDADAYGELLDNADAVIHNAADWRSMVGRTQDPGTIVRDNVEASVRLMDASRPRPFVFMSSVAVHHDIRDRWEGVIDTDHPTRPGGYYGAYKAAVEAFLWAEHASHGRRFASLRPCAVYGLDPRRDRSIGHPIVKKIAEGQRFDRSGGGKFVHVEDVAHAAALAATRDDCPMLIDLVDCYARWADWATMIAEHLGVSAEIDDSSPSAPKNMFSKQSAQRLGLSIDRGHKGIADHIASLVHAMREAREIA